MASRGLSKKAKAEAYDALEKEAGLMRLLLYDIGHDREPEVDVESSAPDPFEPKDVVHCRGRAWRLGGAVGGIALLTIWTEGPYGKSASDTRVLRVDDVRGNDGRTAYERAMGQVGDMLRTAREVHYA